MHKIFALGNSLTAEPFLKVCLVLIPGGKRFFRCVAVKLDIMIFAFIPAVFPFL